MAEKLKGAGTVDEVYYDCKDWIEDIQIQKKELQRKSDVIHRLEKELSEKRRRIEKRALKRKVRIEAGAA